MKSVVKLIISIVICQLAGAVGAIFTSAAIPDWYAGLNKPSFNPPNWLFGPVWTLLYLLMGVAVYLVWGQKNSGGRNTALIFFAIQLGLNVLWSIIFFGLRSPAMALGEILVLALFIVLTIIKFFPISKVSAYLLIPYLLWVGFASILNFYIVKLN
jgi:benzodiazapine receptor